LGQAGDGYPGVVVEQVEDFDLVAVGEVPVGDVGLPQLIGHGGFEAFPRRAGPFVRLSDDEASAFEDAPNR
jgi:hypothetical protein